MDVRYAPHCPACSPKSENSAYCFVCDKNSGWIVLMSLADVFGFSWRYAQHLGLGANAEAKEIKLLRESGHSGLAMALAMGAAIWTSLYVAEHELI